MPTLAQLSNDIANLKFKYQGLEFNVKYCPSKYTSEIEDQWQNAVKAERRDEAIIAMCDAILVDWDLTEEDQETKIPPHLPHLKKVPVRFLNALLRVITEDVTPNP